MEFGASNRRNRSCIGRRRACKEIRWNSRSRRAIAFVVVMVERARRPVVSLGYRVRRSINSLLVAKVSMLRQVAFVGRTNEVDISDS